MKIKLLCDSMCDIPDDVRVKDFVEMIPLTINIGEREYKDGIDFTKEEFYDVLVNSETLPKTSQVTYIQFKEAFEKYVNEGYDVICITGSSKASGTYQSATMAKNDVKGNIYLFDSLFLSLGSGQYVIKACELIEETDLSAGEIVNELEGLRESVNLFFVPFTLDYLKERLNKGETTEFSSLMTECECKIECVVTFLALLEMIKQRLVKVYQNGNFGEIFIEKLSYEVEDNNNE